MNKKGGGGVSCVLAEVGLHAEGVHPFFFFFFLNRKIVANTLLHITDDWQHRPHS